MKFLWAPWRMKYIEYTKVEKEQECFICKAAESDNLEEHLVIHRDCYVILLMNKFPYNTGHLLLAPRRHVAEFLELTRDELYNLAESIKLSVELVKRALTPDGLNLGVNLGRAAGAGLESHLHIHIVPRWIGDTNFMPVIADTKVIPESLNDTFRRLKEHSHIFEAFQA
ncbi:MAG: HIT domain-containing protein [Thermofilaceae archaeon]